MPSTAIAADLVAASGRNADRPALWVNGKTLTYKDLFRDAMRLAAALMHRGVQRGDRVAILSQRSSTAYLSVLAALLAGATYVPLNPRFPVERNRSILRLSGARALIVDQRNLGFAVASSDDSDGPQIILAPESRRGVETSINLTSAEELPAIADADEMDLGASGDALAYLLFTSGSTGVPKGVPISHGNLAAYVANITEVAGGIGPGDRLAQLADLTFDISVHDMFASWLNGACVISIPENASLMATRFVQDHEVTGWFSVPSTAGMLKQTGLLLPNSMPSLRFTFFCGEALAGQVAEAWAMAAPNSALWNLYGPTEATVAFTAFRYRPGQAEPPPVVALGVPYPGQEIELFSPDAPSAVAEDAVGEICLCGTQVTQGYWQAPDLNAQRFFHANGKRWYRTGDLGRRSRAGGFLFAGRVDHQVKIRGYRVELQEIEFVVRRASGADVVAVIPWPLAGDGGATGCVAFVARPGGDAVAIQAECKRVLPDYMVPARIVFLREMPLNPNGKVDYVRLASHETLTGGAS